MGSKSSSSRIALPVQTQVGTSISRANEYLTLSRTRTGNELPNHVSKIKNKENATTSLDASESVLELYRPGYFRGIDTSAIPTQSARGDTGLGISTQVPVVVPANFTGIKNEAIAACTSKAYSIINKLQSPLQSQVMLGELKETIQLLKNPIARSVKLTESLFTAISRQGSGKGIAAANAALTKNAAKSWLEFRFGILPIISDIRTITQAIQDAADKDEVLSYRCYSKKQIVITTATVANRVYGFESHGTRATVRTAEHIIRFGLLNRVLDDIESKAAKAQFYLGRLEEVPLTLYEIAPYSWLADYFVNAQDILTASLTGTSMVSYTSQSTILTEMDTQHVYATKAKYGFCKVIEERPRVLSVKTRQVTRRGTQLGIPPVVFHLPGSDIKYMNIAALLASF